MVHPWTNVTPSLSNIYTQAVTHQQPALLCQGPPKQEWVWLGPGCPFSASWLLLPWLDPQVPGLLLPIPLTPGNNGCPALPLPLDSSGFCLPRDSVRSLWLRSHFVRVPAPSASFLFSPSWSAFMETSWVSGSHLPLLPRKGRLVPSPGLAPSFPHSSAREEESSSGQTQSRACSTPCHYLERLAEEKSTSVPCHPYGCLGG